MATKFIPTGFGTIEVITDFGPQGTFTVEEARSQYGYTGTAQDRRTQEAGGPASNPVSSGAPVPTAPKALSSDTQTRELVRQDNLLNAAVTAGLLDATWISANPQRVPDVVRLLGDNPSTDFYRFGYFGHPTRTPPPAIAPAEVVVKPATGAPALVARAAQNEIKQSMNELGRFDYGKLAKYPHLSKTDTKTWEKFLAKYPRAYQWADYDETVGQGRVKE